MRKLFTSESVARGHPDKICDQISDAVLDDLLKQDKYSRVAVETAVKNSGVFLLGEITTNGFCNFSDVARRVLKDIGYTNPRFGIDYEDAIVLNAISKQSQDISIGVNGTTNHEQGAGDQGMMFGYACNETRELMPMPIMFAHRLVKRLEYARKQGIIPHLGPDGKSQVTVEYEGNEPKRLEAIVIAQQHTDEISEEELRNLIMSHVIHYVCENFRKKDTKIHINATGRFVVGGPEGDAGVTGRKIIVDTYGGMGRHGGGAFSGKDPSKVDRSAAYMARHVAKSIVGNNLAKKCEVQIAYAIGVAKPVSVMVDTFGTGGAIDETIVRWINENFDLRPKAIIEYLDLLRPIYEKTAFYGHFGRNEPEFTWEKIKELK
jgi:S-adenosylmethionine synthetase